MNIGDKVCYSRKWLKNTGQHTGEFPFARGIITHLTTFKYSTIATIEWDNPDIPKKVNVKNLSKISKRGIEESI
jgi:hypothetical protein